MISIILPTFNGSRYLRQSIDSCLAQSCPDIELIIVDDASTDETPGIVHSYQDRRVQYVRNEKNAGIVASLNRGFALASGDLLTWTSDDNYYEPGALAVMASVLEGDPAIDFVYSFYNMVDDTGRVIKPGRVRVPQELDEDNCVGGCFLYRRRVYEALGGFSAQAFLAEDYEYWLRVRAHFRMKMIEQVLYHYRVQPGSLTSKHGEDRVQDQVAKVRRPFIPAWKHFFFLGKRHYHANRRLRSFGNVFLSLILNPLNKSGWRILALVSLPRWIVALLRG